jgi:aspartate/methionine/tyrosine aminotransferase
LPIAAFCSIMGAPWVQARHSRRAKVRCTGPARKEEDGSMPFYPFAMEEMMSEWEKVVTYNLSESGVYPVTARELVGDPAELERLLDVGLDYSQTNGTPELRERICALYPGSTPDHVLVTTGASEANYLAVWTLLEPGDELVMMLPNYMQIWGLAKSLGIAVKPFHLREERGWAPDLDELAAAVSARTKVIAVCNPNNPTGRILTGAEMDAIVAAAERAGAWLLADEVYAGAERLTDEETPSFWGRYDKVLVQQSLSKAYGLPGLRLGWTVAPPELRDALWRRQEYIVICPSVLSDRLAQVALSPEVRPAILRRGRDYIRRGFPVLQEWLAGHGDLFSLVPPQAAAISFVRYNLAVNSTRLVERLIEEQSVLMVPGDHFGLDHHLRISFGLPHDYLRAALARVGHLVRRLQEAAGPDGQD